MSLYSNVYAINGVMNTGNTVLQNLQEVCTASGVWFVYDISAGYWDVVINQAGNSVKSFTDNNIIGNIDLMTTSLTEYYNEVEFKFPHKDLLDQADYEIFKIPTNQLLPNERLNRLTLSSDLVNNPIQARLLAARELKQSRIDKVIKFTADYTSLGLRAGDIITVTATMYGFTNKLFRITTLEETDLDDGGLGIVITALEYSASVYDTSGLEYVEKTIETGIRNSAGNTETQASDNAATLSNFNSALNDANNASLIAAYNANNLRSINDGLANPSNSALITALATSLIPKISAQVGGGGGSLVALETAVFTRSVSQVNTAFNAYAGSNVAFNTNYSGDPNSYVDISFSSSSQVQTLVLEISVPLGTMSYNNSNRRVDGFYAYFPSSYTLYYNGSPVSNNTADWQTSFVKLILTDAAPGTYSIQVTPLLTYDLDQVTTFNIFPFNYNTSSQPSGGGITLSLFAYYI